MKNFSNVVFLPNGKGIEIEFDDGSIQVIDAPHETMFATDVNLFFTATLVSAIVALTARVKELEEKG